jgi:Carboxypeptidase regulatory-like domain
MSMLAGPRSVYAITLISCAAVAVAPPRALAQVAPKSANLQGQVVDSAGHPLRAALVETDDPARAALSDDKGFFHFAGLPAGPITIRVSHTGFGGTEFELRLPADSTVNIGVKLTHDVQELKPVNVTGTTEAAEVGVNVRRRIRVQSADGYPVVHAVVNVEGGSLQLTDEKGELSLGPGARATFAVRVRHMGYAPWYGTATFSDSVRVFRVTLPRLAQTLAAVTVNGTTIKSSLELNGFYDRWMMRQKGLLSAVFIGPEEIEFRHPSKVTDMLYGLNGVRMIRNTVTGEVLPYSTRAASSKGQLCPMAIVIDGQQLAFRPSIDMLVGGSEVAGIEVYVRGGNMPASLNVNDSICGVIVIWTGSRQP